MADQPKTTNEETFPGGVGECRRCGCTDLRVVNTIRRGDEIIRYRECRHCGKRIRTRETCY